MKKTPLKPSQSPMRRSTELTRTRIKQKRKQRSAEEELARRLVMARAANHCEGCGRPGPCEWSHRVGRGQRGVWSASNGMALCGDMTGGHAPTPGGGCHPWASSGKGRKEAERRGWILRSHQDPATTPAFLHVGRVLLSPTGTYLPIEESSMIKQFRKLPVVISAVQWTGDNEDTVQQLTGPHHFYAVDFEDRLKDPDITARVLDDLHSTWVGVKTGQWVIKGVAGEFYPIDETVLAETYEQVVA